MFGFIRKTFIGSLSASTKGSFSESLMSNFKGPIKCVSLNIRPCRARLTFVDINSNETLFSLLTVSANKYGGSCNTINDPYARVCVPNKIKEC